MSTKLKFSLKGPDWPELSIPDWYKERAAPIIERLGADHPESKALQKILDAGKIEEAAVDELDDLANKSGNVPFIMLAVDTVQHSFTTIMMMTLIPLRVA